MALSKKAKKINELLDLTKNYEPKAAFEQLKELPKAKFNESVDVSVNLGVDPRKSDQVVRGSVVLPKGTGKKVRIAVFTSAANVDKAKEAGADLVGMEDLAADVKSGKIDFDLLLATPDAMRVVGQLGQILGPRGLMPNPKDGTVTTDIVTAVNNAKKGQVRYRTDKNGIVHFSIGKLDFSSDDLYENFSAVLAALVRSKPSSAKGSYMKKVSLSTTMGPGLTVDMSTVNL